MSRGNRLIRRPMAGSCGVPERIVIGRHSDVRFSKFVSEGCRSASGHLKRFWGGAECQTQIKPL